MNNIQIHDVFAKKFSENNFPIIDIVHFEVNVVLRCSMLRLYTTLFFCTTKIIEHVIFRAFLNLIAFQDSPNGSTQTNQ
jgi:hypothetical protein